MIINSDGIVRSRRLSAAIGASANSSDSPFQSYVLKRGQGETMKPSWEHPTIFRILPGLNPDNPAVLDPWRFSANTDDYGQWFYPVDIASVMCESNNKTSRTWVTRDPFDASYNMRNNPLVIMRSAIQSAYMQKLPICVNWLGLTKGGQGRGPELAPPKESWLVQCVIMEHNGKTFPVPKGFGPEDRTVFLVLTISAVQALKRCIELRNPDFRGDPIDIAGQFINGDPISLNAGAYITMFNRTKDPRNVPSRSGGFSAFAAQPSKDGITLPGYDAFVTKEYMGGSADLTEYEDIVLSKVRPWHEAVFIPTDEEQVKYLEQVYRPFSDLLVYALDDAYGAVLDPKIRREGLEKLGRGVSTSVNLVAEPANSQPFARPVAPVQAPVSAAPVFKRVTAPAAPQPVAVAQPFGRPPVSRGSEAVENPTSTHGISESPDIPVMRNSLGSDQDTANAMELVARARRESMRGGSVPRPGANG